MTVNRYNCLTGVYADEKTLVFPCSREYIHRSGKENYNSTVPLNHCNLLIINHFKIPYYYSTRLDTCIIEIYFRTLQIKSAKNGGRA